MAGRSITFAVQAERYLTWLATKNSPAKPTSIATVRSLLERHAVPVIGDEPLVKIDNETMRLLVARLVQQKRLSSNSIQHVQKFVKRVIANAKDNRGNQLYPRTWDREFIDLPKPTKRHQPVATHEQIERGLASAPDVTREMLVILAASGIRRGEALALNVQDFDTKIGALHIRGTRSYFGETAPKTEDSERVVDLHPDIAAILARLIGSQASGRLFNVTIDEFRRGFERLGIPPHSLRRFRVTWLRKQRCPEDILRLWIGHGTRSKSQTDEYSFLSNDVELRQRLVREVGLGFALPAVSTPAEVAEAVSA